MTEELSHLFQPHRNVLNEHLVSAKIDRSSTTLGKDALQRIGEELRKGVGLGVVELEGFRAQGLQFGDLCAGLQGELLLGRELVARRDPDHVAVLAHVQAAGLKDDVERLVPWYVLQAQREVTAHRVAGDDVQVGEVRYDVQHPPHFDVLEVERQLLAGISAARALHQFVGIVLDRSHLEHELRVGLVGIVLPETARFDHHAHVVALGENAEGLHRGCEVNHVVALAQHVGNAGLEEIDDYRLSLLADIHTGRRVRKLDDDSPLATASASEIDVFQSVLNVRSAFRKARSAACRGLLRTPRGGQGDQQAAAFDLGLVRNHVA